MKQHYFLRWTFFLTGLVILALGITLTIKGQRLGIGPWDVLHLGLFWQFGLTVGTWSIIMGLLIIAAVVFITKRPPRIGAILNMLLIGLFIDIFNWIIPEPASLPGIIAIFLLGIVVMGYGVGIYVSANLGAGPRDSVMMLIVEKTGWKISRVRSGIELAALAAGYSLGGPVGIGTVVAALCVGSVVHLSLPQSKMLLTRLAEKNHSNDNTQWAAKKG
ncbi:YczE/YyaS/YitT family protein [Jeotgalibacillus campisalis]|uniref:Membrane protein n=1 Tax=Jeotgalibacillus campisalis TaxID=220754 RepID=A0A0C2VV15_9BACL|nr:YitT family protein [Jeotgalibacillus campisalis]KIL52762.1 membrane protein [Jeotgalibacillus campisalis]